MLSRRIAAARPLARALQPAPRTALTQIRCLSQADIEDPDMNGGYINPPPIKRQFRDPYADWWDKQERRNYGEPVHEDNDILGIFSPEVYTHYKPGFGAVLLGTFVASVFGLCAVVYQFYPDKPSVPRTFPGGLDRELGGKGALLARTDETPAEPTSFVETAGIGKTHAKDGGKASYVPLAIQEALPKQVERAVPNIIHDTGDKAVTYHDEEAADKK